MSAVYGIINKYGEPIAPNDIHNLREAIKHRLVHNAKVYIVGGCALGVSANYTEEEQIYIETDEYVLIASACIDDKEQLKSLLGLNGSVAYSLSEILLQAFKKWGNNYVTYLEGEFVCVIWNKISKRLLIATDHIGLRPLFYYDGPKQFIFCSEIKGVAAVKPTPNFFNEMHLISYHYRNGEPNQTYDKDIYALCGGNVLNLKDGRTQISKYWNLQPTGKYAFKRDEEWVDCLRELLFRAVEKRLNADLPVGVTLSGGLDSTFVTCILSQLLIKKNRPLFTFSSVLPVNYKGIEKDERGYIDIVKKFCSNIIATDIETNEVNPFLNIEAAFEKYESLPNVFFYVDDAILKNAQAKGVKNLFSGYGGDFWLSWSGNRVIYDLINKGRYGKAWQLLKSFSAAGDERLWTLFKKEYVNYNYLYNLWLKKTRPARADWQKETMLRKDFMANYQAQTTTVDIKERSKYMQNYVCTGEMGRIAGMLNNRNSFYGMQSSEPMFDKDVLDLLVETPLHLFNLGGYKRGLIRAAMKGVVPDEIRHRDDKLPYAPGYHNLIIKNKQVLDNLVTSVQFEGVFDKYFDKEKILACFNKIEPQGGFTSSKNIVGIRTMQAVIAVIALNYLFEKKYIIV